jgi:hypothetical protein
VPLGLVVGVVRCLEDEDLAVAALERGHDQPDFGAAKEPANPEPIGQEGVESGSVISVADDVQTVVPKAPQAAAEASGKRPEDLAASLDVEVLEVASGEAGAQSETQDATRRGSRDEVEVVAD